jgi:hypothetical protein
MSENISFTCKKCSQTKDVTDMVTMKGNPINVCRSCNSARALAWYLKNKERAKEMNDRWGAQKVHCECGHVVGKRSIYSHVISKVHIKKMSALKPQEQAI